MVAKKTSKKKFSDFRPRFTYPGNSAFLVTIGNLSEWHKTYLYYVIIGRMNELMEK